MNIKTVYALMIALCLNTFCANTYAATDKKMPQDEAIVVGACMVQKFKQRTPPIPQAKIAKCADAIASAVPKCLGLDDTEYDAIIRLCFTELTNDKCVAGKMNVPIKNYVSCGYQKKPAVCYKVLGFTSDQVEKFKADCQKPVK